MLNDGNGVKKIAENFFFSYRISGQIEFSFGNNAQNSGQASEISVPRVRNGEVDFLSREKSIFPQNFPPPSSMQFSQTYHKVFDKGRIFFHSGTDSAKNTNFGGDKIPEDYLFLGSECSPIKCTPRFFCGKQKSLCSESGKKSKLSKKYIYFFQNVLLDGQNELLKELTEVFGRKIYFLPQCPQITGFFKEVERFY